MGLPVGGFVAHNTFDQEFSISQTSASAFVGEYDVTVESSFLQPQLVGGPLTITSQVEFTLIVNPCTVSSFDEISAPIGTITYVLGDATFSFGPYAFA